jgi:hypothetical protein
MAATAQTRRAGWPTCDGGGGSGRAWGRGRASWSGRAGQQGAVARAATAGRGEWSRGGGRLRLG